MRMKFDIGSIDSGRNINENTTNFSFFINRMINAISTARKRNAAMNFGSNTDCTSGFWIYADRCSGTSIFTV